ncbi:MAG: Asp/Glu racemase [Ascidiaceihabitans sp.]|nr:Asp/Glu racemase [Ascidiaceihabitans sp.]
MTVFSYELAPDGAAPLGLIVLQTDETIERDMQRMLAGVALYVSRVPSGAEVTSDTLQQMAGQITHAADLLPQAQDFGVIGYGCTSGTAQIGPGQIAQLVNEGAKTSHVSEPVSALQAACAHLGIKRLAFLSPYIEEVSGKLRDVLAAGGVQTPVFGSFAEAQEAKVVRISGPSIIAAATALCKDADVDALFLSCTNLRTLDAIDPLEQAIGLPVLSSNQVLAWHMARLGGVAAQGPGQLFAPT